MTGYTACALRNLLLDATVRDVGIDGLFCEAGVACTSGKEFGCDGSTYGERVSLSERTGCVLYATCDVKFRMTCSGATPLAELFELCLLYTSDAADD